MKTAQNFFDIGTELLLAGKYQEAINNYKKSIEIDPNFYLAYFNWGGYLQALAQSKKGEEAELLYKKAIEKNEQVIRIKPNYCEAFYRIGIILTEIANTKELKEATYIYKEAIKKYEKGYQLESTDNPDIYERWGYALFKLADNTEGNSSEKLYIEAIKKFKKSTQLKSDHYGAYLNWAAALSRIAHMKNKDETEKWLLKSETTYEICFKINPNEYEAFYNSAINLYELALVKKGEESERLYKKALKNLEKVIKIVPNHYGAFYREGAILFNLGRKIERITEKEAGLYEKAIVKFKKVLEINPNYYPALIFLGKSLFNLASIKKNEISLILYEEAIEKEKEAIKFNWEQTDAYEILYLSFYALKRYPDAIENLNIYLYLSINSNKKINNISYINNILLENNQPLNIITFLDNTGISINSYLDNYIPITTEVKLRENTHSFPLYLFYEELFFDTVLKNSFQDAFETIKDFLYLLEYYIHSRQIDESLLAVIYFYLGGIVKSYKMYDEVLDCNNNYSMSARDLYYYARCTEFISLEKNTIIKNCINDCPTHSYEDIYYLAHLHWLNDDREKAIELFNQSQTFKYSKLIVEYLNNNHFNNKNNNNTKLQTDFGKFKDSITDYFHLNECNMIINHADEKIPLEEIWRYFTIDKEELYLKKRKFEMKFVEEQLAKNLAIGFKNRKTFKGSGYDNDLYLKELEIFDFLKEQSRQLRSSINKNKYNIKDFENSIANRIELYEADKRPMFYQDIIIYFYHSKDIDLKQFFRLSAYFMYILRKNKEQDINKFLFGLVSSFSKAGKILSIILQAYNLSRDIEKDYRKTDETISYKSFKENLWKYVSYLKETKSEKYFMLNFGIKTAENTL